ncbi:MAG: hypothetical protein R3339_10300, partial [Thermodesulfobacteriota bacterium]|nr:hypothetical protein [Thermodesulfobacteriota bacterium]
MKRLLAALLTVLIITSGSYSFSEHKESGTPEKLSPVTESGKSSNPENETFHENSFLIDFTDYEEGSIEEWLEQKGFELKEAAKNRKKLDLDVDEGALFFEAKKPLRALIVKKFEDPGEYSKIKIEWGTIKYPRGASYEGKINNEALLVLVFFGDEKISSGHLAIPDSPYFIGLFLGKDEKLNKAYKGDYYHEGGRFVCLGSPEPGETVISEFDLFDAFKSYFHKDEVPNISGVALGIDTTSSDDDGRA